MYGNSRTWAHDSIGIWLLQKTWYLPEGCTGSGFETWVLVANPTTSNATVTLTFMTPEGPKEAPVDILPPGTRRSYNVHDAVPNAFSVSTMVVSTGYMVVERAMYGNSI